MSTTTHHPFVRSAYNYDTGLASLSNGLICEDPTRAQQQFLEECDINTIVRRFGVTGELPHVTRQPLEGDFTTVTDYHSAMNLIVQADMSFMELPAEVRTRFENDPGRFVAFCSDPANREEAKKLGIVQGGASPPQPPPITAQQEVTAPPQPSSST